MSKKQQQTIPQFMTTVSIAELFGVNRKTVLDWIEAGYFPHAFKTSQVSKAAWLIPTEEVLSYKRERDQAKSA